MIFKKLIFICFIVMCSCDEINILENDKQISSEIGLEDFNQIVVNGIANITLSQGLEHKAIIQGFEKKVNDAQLIVNNKILNIKSNHLNITTNFEPINIKLFLKDISKISCLKPCEITSTSILYLDEFTFHSTTHAELVETDIMLNCKKLNIITEGSIAGKFKFSGNSNSSILSMNGFSSVFAENLICDSVKISQNSLGSVRVHSNKKLNITFYTNGNVYYKGNPEITINRVNINNQSPTGKVIKIVD